MITQFDDLAGASVAVWGLGLEGRAVLGLLPASCRVFVISEDVSDANAVAAGRRHSARVITPAESVRAGAIDVLFRSPGVSVHRDEIRALRSQGTRITSLLEMWMPIAPVETLIGVTGTKGKSTTSMVIADLLERSGKSVELAGNIGRVVSLVESADIAVVEISSYQAAGISVSPNVGVLTNLDVDHLPWHGSIRQYHADKLQLFVNPELEHLISPHTTIDAVRDHAPRALSLNTTPEDLGYRHEGGVLFRRGDRVADASSSALAPIHMLDNLLIACAAADVVLDGNLDADVIEESVRNFVLPPGRLEVVPSSDGITWVNDPLASNPLAAGAAVRTYRSADVIVILGGEDRDVDPAPLLAAIREHGRIRAAITLGSAGVAWRSRLEDLTMVVSIGSDDVAAAVVAATRIAKHGDVVVFSPGAPTTRSIGNWENRRSAFSSAVETETNRTS